MFQNLRIVFRCFQKLRIGLNGLSGLNGLNGLNGLEGAVA